MTANLPLAPDMIAELRADQVICDKALTLTTPENQALARSTEYQPFEFFNLEQACFRDWKVLSYFSVTGGKFGCVSARRNARVVQKRKSCFSRFNAY